MTANQYSSRTGLLALTLMLSVLPLLCALSAYTDSRYGLLTLFLLVSMTPMSLLLITRDGNDKDRIFMITIFCVSTALLMSATFSSTLLLGWDIHGEYFVLQDVLTSHHWQSSVNLQYNSVLSVTILPSMLAVITGLDGSQLLKFVYPMLYSTMPVILYKLCRRIVPPEGAFLSAFLFMAYPTFYVESIGLARQEIAEILLAVALWVLVNDKYRSVGGRLVLMILSLGIVVSHYSIAYLYIPVLVFAYLVLKRSAAQFVDATMTLTMILMTAAWYVFMALGREVRSVAFFGSSVIEAIVSDFFSQASRPSTVLQALGLQSTIPGIMHSLNRFTSYLVILLILVGFAFLVREKKRSVTKTRLLALSCSGLMFLLLGVAIPFFASGLNLGRLFHLALLLMSPCFAYGLIGLASTSRAISAKIQPRWPVLSRRSAYRLGAVVILSYCLFNSGWMWAITGDSPTSVLLDRQRMLDSHQPALEAWVLSYYTPSEDAAGARWFGIYHANRTIICADYDGQYNALASYGKLPREPSRLPDYCDFAQSYVFLRSLNTHYGVGTSFDTEWPVSEIQPNLTTMNKVYSNGGVTIYAPNG